MGAWSRVMIRSLCLVLGALLVAAPVSAEGKFVPISKECMVRNTSKNCGFCSIEIIARHMGMEHMRGFAVGKGGCTASSMAGWLKRYNVQFEQATSRGASIALMKKFLDADLPVLFSIPGHALVCHGWTVTPELGERIWVVDNTGREGCVMKGWPKAEFDRRFDGWVCGLFPLFPGRTPRTPPGPKTPPGPHVDPTPDLLVNPMAKRMEELEARLKALEKEAPAIVAVREEVKGLKGKLPELVEKVGGVVAKFGGVEGILAMAQEDLPKLKSLVDRLKADGLLTDAKASKANEILDKVVSHVGRIAEVEKRIDPIISAVPWGTILGSLGAGTGGLGAILGMFALLRRARGGSAAPGTPDVLATILSAIQALRADKPAAAAGA